jgi:hypothetical protein
VSASGVHASLAWEVTWPLMPNTRAVWPGALAVLGVMQGATRVPLVERSCRCTCVSHISPGTYALALHHAAASWQRQQAAAGSSSQGNAICRCTQGQELEAPVTQAGRFGAIGCSVSVFT